MVAYTNESLIDLQADLLNALPENTHGADSKDSRSHFIPAEEALHHKFIRYGTQKTFNVLMFDIDDVQSSLEDYHEHIYKTIGIYPTFTLKTDRGFHFGLILDKVAFRTKYESTAKTTEALIAASLKEKITILLNGDIAGSKRLIGIWRNPLMHDHIYTGNIFNLLELAKRFDIAKPAEVKQTPLNNTSNVKMKLKSDSKIETDIKNGFFVGNRNNYLFSIGYKIVFEDRSKASTIKEELMQINNSHSNQLKEYEVIKISESILKLVPTMFSPKRKPVRGPLSNEMWELNIHGVENRRRYAGYVTSRKRREKTALTVLDALINLFEKGKATPTNKEVTKETSISVRQYQRVKKSINTTTIFMMWIENLREGVREREVDIRVYVMGYIKELFENSIKELKSQSFNNSYTKRDEIDWNTYQNGQPLEYVPA